MILSVPLNLAITPSQAATALESFAPNASALSSLSERELICSYIVLHWILKGDGGIEPTETALAHQPYLDVLPKPNQFLTPLYFTPEEASLLRGTMLEGAAQDRMQTLLNEWRHCQSVWGDELSAGFTWQRYLAATTYLSSRAFPSTLLSETPSLRAVPQSHPVLFPVIDSLNHRRALPISWLVHSSQNERALALVVHSPIEKGEEAFNNYGPKPNSELILVYGFSLAENPDDTIVLKIGGGHSATTGKKWEVGRDANGIEEVYAAILEEMSSGGQIETRIEDESTALQLQYDAASMLQSMLEQMLLKFTTLSNLDLLHNDAGIRPAVLQMVRHYMEGQTAIVRCAIMWASLKADEIAETAEAHGIAVEVEDATDDSDGEPASDLPMEY